MGRGDRRSTEERYEELSWLAKMVWDFYRSLSGQLSNPYDEAAFQAELYKNIDPDTTKSIITAYHCLNHAMQKIIPLVNFLPIFF